MKNYVTKIGYLTSRINKILVIIPVTAKERVVMETASVKMLLSHFLVQCPHQQQNYSSCFAVTAINVFAAGNMRINFLSRNIIEGLSGDAFSGVRP